MEVFEKGDLTEREINTALKLISKNETAIKKNISKFSEGQKVKPIKLK